MSKLIYSYDHHDYVIELCKSDAKVLLPLLKKDLKVLQKRLEHYLDIHESGEATVRQQNVLCEAEDAVDKVDGIIADLNGLLGNIKTN